MEGSSIRNKFIQTGAYVLFSLGIISFLALILAGIAIFLYFPEGSLSKKAIIGGAVIIVALIVLLLSIAVFESMIELTKVGEAVIEIEEKMDKDDMPQMETKLEEPIGKTESMNV